MKKNLIVLLSAAFLITAVAVYFIAFHQDQDTIKKQRTEISAQLEQKQSVLAIIDEYLSLRASAEAGEEIDIERLSTLQDQIISSDSIVISPKSDSEAFYNETKAWRTIISMEADELKQKLE